MEKARYKFLIIIIIITFLCHKPSLKQKHFVALSSWICLIIA